MKILAAITVAASLLLASSSAQATSSDRYDLLIRAAVERYWPGLTHDWLWWKAQLIAESNLNPDAVSRAGAIGIAQFMPKTWVEVSRDLRLGDVSPREAKYAIMAGAYYMVKVSLYWEPGINAPRSGLQRLKLSQASYNAGAGNILRAQRACNDAWPWALIRECLHLVTGRHSAETIGYVDRIERIHNNLRTAP